VYARGYDIGRGMIMMNMKPYYVPQNDWGSNDYYSLHRYLHRLVLRAESKKDEIEQLDIRKMTDETKVLLYCIIRYYNLEQLFELPNLKKLAECKPLSEPLVLSSHGLKEESVYYKMNVML
jgi:hypothetical protein